MTLTTNERDRMFRTSLLQAETQKRALTASVIRLYEQAERAEAENEQLRAQLAKQAAA